MMAMIQGAMGAKMSTQYSLQKDLDEALKMARALEDYIRADQLYGSVGGGLFGGGSSPSLTIGALIMRLRRLEALQSHLSAADRDKLGQAQSLHQMVRDEWNLHYEQKLLKEANSRLDAMRTFFRECQDNTRLCANIYKPEALRRTIVQEILDVMTAQSIASAELDDKVTMTDGQLRAHFQPGDFLWDAVLQDIYPRDPFWWLWGEPPRPSD